MRVAVIGAGIAGLVTAHELADAGHEVTVFDRRGSVAAEGSFAHGGLVAPGLSDPWGGLGGHSGGRLAWLPRPSPGGLSGSMSGAMSVLRGPLGWRWQAWRAQRGPAAAALELAWRRLERHGQDGLHALIDGRQLDFERSRGALLLWRRAGDEPRWARRLTELTELGIAAQVLDPAGCRAIEPGLNPDALRGGLHLPDAMGGNGRQFAYQVRDAAAALGVRFRLHTAVLQLAPGPAPRLRHLHHPPDAVPLRPGHGRSRERDAQPTQPLADTPVDSAFDAVVVCSAMAALELLVPLGLRLPLAMVHGASITAPLRHDEHHPEADLRACVVDDRTQVAIARLGPRIRVSGGALLRAPGQAPREAAFAPIHETLYRVLQDWYPGLAQLDRAQRWHGARPTLADGRPRIGPSGLDGVWLHFGHAASGWALACGGARLIADRLSGRGGELSAEGLMPPE